ncbi:MAG: hypothetical protein GY738_25840 [Pseudoalteromonas sp.]|nr:hypothetical protein [Pseudoalteromonas sp.]
MQRQDEQGIHVEPDDVDLCAACHTSGDGDHWIDCDICHNWFHIRCAGIKMDRLQIPLENFVCKLRIVVLLHDVSRYFFADVTLLLLPTCSAFITRNSWYK